MSRLYARTEKAYTLSIPACTPRFTDWRINQSKMGPTHEPRTYLLAPGSPASKLRIVTPASADVATLMHDTLTDIVMVLFALSGGRLEALRAVAMAFSGPTQACYIVDLPVPHDECTALKERLEIHLVHLRRLGIWAQTITPVNNPSILGIVIENLGEVSD